MRDTEKLFVIDRFDDIVANLKVWSIYGVDEAKELVKLCKNTSTSKFDLLENMLYQDVLDVDFGIKNPELQPYVEKLKGINFLSGMPVKSVRDCRVQIKRFYHVIRPLLDEMSEEEKKVCGEISIYLLPKK